MRLAKAGQEGRIKARVVADPKYVSPRPVVFVGLN